MNTAVLEWVLGVGTLALQAILLYLLAPPRLVVAARVVENAAGGSVLRVAVQSMERLVVIESIRVRLDVEGPGDIDNVASVPVYLGTAEDFAHAGVQRTERGVTLSIDRLRPTKTWVFEIPCTRGTKRARVLVEGPRRRLATMLPGLSDARVGELRPGGNFSFELSATDRPGAVMGARFARTRIFATIIGSALSLYGLVVGMSGQSSREYGPEYEAILPVALVVVIGILFALVRPRPPIVARGYLEPWLVRVQP